MQWSEYIITNQLLVGAPHDTTYQSGLLYGNQQELRFNLVHHFSNKSQFESTSTLQLPHFQVPFDHVQHFLESAFIYTDSVGNLIQMPPFIPYRVNVSLCSSNIFVDIVGKIILPHLLRMWASHVQPNSILKCGGDQLTLCRLWTMLLIVKHYNRVRTDLVSS